MRDGLDTELECGTGAYWNAECEKDANAGSGTFGDAGLLPAKPLPPPSPFERRQMASMMGEIVIENIIPAVGDLDRDVRTLRTLRSMRGGVYFSQPKATSLAQCLFQSTLKL